jgi:signal transduction histidine kinase
MRERPSSATRQRIGWIGILICVSAGMLTWSGYRAIREWQRSSLLLVQHSTEDAADLLLRALTRDMRAVQGSVLPALNWRDFVANPPSEARDVVATTFARYPYPESFFAWHDIDAGEHIRFFIRYDRPPAWVVSRGRPSGSAVSVLTDAPIAHLITTRIRADISQRRQFSVFELQIGDILYQVVSRIQYHDRLRLKAEGAIGFMVNIPWVRQHYFLELTEQVAQLAQSESGLLLGIVDDRDNLVSGTRPSSPAEYSTRRGFTVSFFDPLLVELDPPADLSQATWLVQADASRARPITAAIRVANRMLILTSFAVSALVLGLALTYRAVRTNASLAELRSEFVSTVTHELKLPIAKIRLAGETLISGRLPTPAKQHRYARIVVRQATHLTRLVDNLLALSRITDVASVYSFEAVDVDELVRSAVGRFSEQLVDAGFDVRVNIPAHLPPIRADSAAIDLMLDNVVDNAMRYSTDTRRLQFTAAADRDFVKLEISDAGCGIPSNEINHVTRKFFRGRGATSTGTGLGLAIVNRIVADHGGRLAIHSVIGVGTTISVSLPLSCEDDEEPNSDR